MGMQNSKSRTAGESGTHVDAVWYRRNKLVSIPEKQPDAHRYRLIAHVMGPSGGQVFPVSLDVAAMHPREIRMLVEWCGGTEILPHPFKSVFEFAISMLARNIWAEERENNRDGAGNFEQLNYANLAALRTTYCSCGERFAMCNKQVCGKCRGIFCTNACCLTRFDNFEDRSKLCEGCSKNVSKCRMCDSKGHNTRDGYHCRDCKGLGWICKHS